MAKAERLPEPLSDYCPKCAGETETYAIMLRGGGRYFLKYLRCAVCHGVKWRRWGWLAVDGRIEGYGTDWVKGSDV